VTFATNRGEGQIIKKSEKWAAANTIHGEKVRGPYFNEPGEFAVRITFDVTRRDSGERKTLEEIAVHTVKNDKITRERFFYEGNWSFVS